MKWIAVLLCLAAGTARGEEDVRSMTWEECLSRAARLHPELAAARFQVEQAVAQVSSARSALLPHISGRAAYSHSKSSGESGGDSYSYSLSGEQLIFDGFESWYNTSRQQQQLISARYSYALTSSEIRLNLREAFIDLLEAQQLLDITEEIAQRRSQQLDMVRLRYQAGTEHKGSLMTAEANLAEARFDVTSARRDIELAQRNLVREMGEDTFSPVAAEGELIPPDSPASVPEIDPIAREHPSVLRQSAQVEAAGYDLKMSEAGFYPEIDGSASIGRRGDTWPPGTENWSAGVSLSLPIFTGGSRFAQVRSDRAALEETKETARRTWDNTVYYLEQAWKQLLESTERVGIQYQFLQADEERARISEAQYATGILSFDNWIIIEDNLVKTRKSYLSVKAEALRAAAEWEYRTGLTIDKELSGEMQYP